MRLAPFLILWSLSFDVASGSVPNPSFTYSFEQISYEKVKSILDDVCPGGSRGGIFKKVDALGCGVALPSKAETAGERVRWGAERVTFGHFLSPTSDDAAISGLNPSNDPDDLEGGTLLATRKAGKWKTVWYKNGVITSHCSRVTLEDRRQILVCEETKKERTHEYHFLYTVDFLKPASAWRSAFFVADSFHNQYAGTQVQRIHGVTIQQPAPGNLLIQVSAIHGSSDEEFQRGAGEIRRVARYPETRPVQLAFYLLGTKFKPTPDTKEWAKLFGRK